MSDPEPLQSPDVDPDDPIEIDTDDDDAEPIEPEYGETTDE